MRREHAKVQVLAACVELVDAADPAAAGGFETEIPADGAGCFAVYQSVQHGAAKFSQQRKPQAARAGFLPQWLVGLGVREHLAGMVKQNEFRRRGDRSFFHHSLHVWQSYVTPT